MKTNTGKIIERWKKHSDSLTGNTYKYNIGGESTLTGKMVVKKINDSWYYCVTGYTVNNLGTTNFKLVSHDNNNYILENKRNDFPQQIVYQNKGKDQLLHG